VSGLPADTPAYLKALAAHAGIDAAGVSPPTEGRARINGLSLRWLDWGDPTAPPIVLLHGGGQSARTWDACCLVLARRHRCLALDQRGHGDSAWSPEGAYGFDDHADDIAAFLDALDLRAPTLAGMSMGGINAIVCAARDPRRLRALVIVDVAPEVQVEPVERMMRGIAANRRFASPRDAAGRLARLGARRDRTLLEATLALNLRRQADGAWTWKYDPRTLADLSAEQILAPRRPLWDVLPRIDCPALVVRGAQSEIFSEADATRLARSLPRASRATVQGARHSVQTDNPAGLAQAMVAFERSLGERPARARPDPGGPEPDQVEAR
jgi:pimeloyl-ACP methyl ester carboxylesterase